MPKANKSALAREMGVSRSSLYYQSKMDLRDQIIKEHILSVLEDHPAYGHKRIAIALGFNKKRVLRIMKKYGILPRKKRGRKPFKKDDHGVEAETYKNWHKLLCPIHPNIFWASDFTYIWFQDRFYYVATIIDIFTREVLGLAISPYHNKELVLEAFKDALIRHDPPYYLHSDQGAEYRSEAYINFAKSQGCIISMAGKGKPWENPYQESFYSNFKLELGSVSRFQDSGEFVEAVYQQIHYYNHKRIHSALRMPPAIYSMQYSKL